MQKKPTSPTKNLKPLVDLNTESSRLRRGPRIYGKRVLNFTMYQGHWSDLLSSKLFLQHDSKNHNVQPAWKNILFNIYTQ